MGLLEILRRSFAKPAARTVSPARTGRRGPEEMAPEVSAAGLMAELHGGNGHAPFLLDCRETYERQQGHIAGSLHIPMNSIPSRLTELERTADIVVYCAHGNRSYSVANWLIGQGYKARSLKGGIADWQLRGGPIERDN